MRFSWSLPAAIMALLVAISATASALSISIQRVYSGALGSSWSDDSLVRRATCPLAAGTCNLAIFSPGAS